MGCQTSPKLFINMIFLAGFNAICIEIRDMQKFRGHVTDFKPNRYMSPISA